MEEFSSVNENEEKVTPVKENNQFFKRVFTGAFIILSVSAAFFLRQFFLDSVGLHLFDIMYFAFAVVGTIEMVRVFKDKMTFFEKTVVLVFSIGYVPVCSFLGIKTGILMLMAAVVMLISDNVFSFEKKTIEGLGYSILTLFYPTVLLTGGIYINHQVGLECLLLLFIVSAFSDSGAMIFGVIFRGRKLYPKISPKKTISGAFGGLFGGTVAAMAIWAFVRGSITDVVGLEIAIYVLAGILGSIATQFGDLVEGAFKRKIGIKDFGDILPGHGGMLDRIDGLFFNSFFLVLYFALISVIF